MQKVPEGAFHKQKALVEAFSEILKTDESFAALVLKKPLYEWGWDGDCWLPLVST